MSRPESDRNLLLGILAVQMDFVGRDALIAAMNAWILDKKCPLGEILVDRGDLAPEDRAVLEPMVDRHIARHGGDPEASLAAVQSRRWADDGPDLVASLTSVHSGGSTEEDPDRTCTIASPTARSSDRYRKIRDHARGGLGVVYLAHDRELNREVALKEIQDRFADDPAARGRFVLEAEVTGGLEHPGIVPVHGLGRYDDGRPFYAMRFVKGDSLKEAIARFHRGEGGDRRIELRKLLRRFLDVCNAVAYAHSRGVLHRDLKPSNVLVGRFGETLVVDWGLAKAVGRPESYGDPLEATLRPASSGDGAETLPNSVLGTPGYMSPEQAAGRIDLIGPTSDVYSLGATLYAILTGRAPVEGKEVGAVLQKVQDGDFPPPRAVSPWIPRPLEAICRKAMSRMPEARYESPAALAEDVERWMADEPTSAGGESPAEKLARWGRRHRTAASGVLGLLVATVVALTIATVVVRGERAEVERQKSLAQANFRETRGLIHHIVYLAETETEPAAAPLRRKILLGAKEYFEKFEREHRNHPELLAELAASQFRIAELLKLLALDPQGRDESGAAEASLRQAADGFARAEAMYGELASRPSAPERFALARDRARSDAEALRPWLQGHTPIPVGLAPKMALERPIAPVRPPAALIEPPPAPPPPAIVAEAPPFRETVKPMEVPRIGEAPLLPPPSPAGAQPPLLTRQVDRGDLSLPAPPAAPSGLGPATVAPPGIIGD